MFLFNWYGGSVTGLPIGAHLVGATVSTTGWQTFTVSRWVWLLTIVVALGSVVMLSRGYKDDGPLPLRALVAALGTLASALIVIRILHHPGPSVSGASVHISYGIKAGIWLGLVAALAIALGGYVQMLPEKPRKAKDAAPEDPAAAFSGLTVSAPSSDSEPHRIDEQ
jgi:ABC-type Co2+ transport system permease subunit